MVSTFNFNDSSDSCVDLSYEQGVLWSGDHTFSGTAETLELLRSRGIYSSSDNFQEDMVTDICLAACRKTGCLRHQ